MKWKLVKSNYGFASDLMVDDECVGWVIPTCEGNFATALTAGGGWLCKTRRQAKKELIVKYVGNRLDQ